ncbi:unnamed protein product [Periconia digitata]|uniref:Transcription factor domain-containing protein n=1 Tax=Periconia digitata TaxID=1303443 RepID=A0A9W4TZR0_9PLEO|nr:unnamed protein product [Periconia digitata]
MIVLDYKVTLLRYRLGLSERNLSSNGFSDWESILGITEDDMSQMQLRLGDRRKIQRMIRDYGSSCPPKCNETGSSWYTTKHKRPHDHQQQPRSHRSVRHPTADASLSEGSRQGRGLGEPTIVATERHRSPICDTTVGQRSPATYQIMRPQDESEPVRLGQDEVCHISVSLCINPNLLDTNTLPQEPVTLKNVKTFLQCTGALVYLWDPSDAMQQVRSLYHPVGGTVPANLVEVIAMATVGSYCDGTLEENASSDQFLQQFVSILSFPLSIGTLPRMRLFACLAICRLTSNIESARVLLLCALNIGREAFASPSFKAETPKVKLRHWWKVFQSVVFLESWLANNTHQNCRVNHEDLNLYEAPLSQSHNVTEICQEQIFQLGRLSTYASLFTMRNMEESSAMEGKHYLNVLTQWRESLPPLMQLSHICLDDPTVSDFQTKHMLLQFHILFLSLVIEPYRKCMRVLGKVRMGNIPIGTADLEALTSVEDYCVVSARQSARVASLVQFDNLVHAHSWTLLYACYVGCIILLHSAMQMLLQGNRDAVGLELAHASSHLGILSVCSYKNEVARRMYGRLQVIFNDAKDLLALPTNIDYMQVTTWDETIASPNEMVMKVAVECQEALTEPTLS